MKDFTLKSYSILVQQLIKSNYTFQTMEDFIEKPLDRAIIMRHDVDRKPQNALRMAKLEKELAVKATYYFRTISQTFKPEIIKEIAKMGHEIGYHYENLCDAEVQIKNLKLKNKNSDKYKQTLFELAIKDFTNNLTKLRRITQINNIAMHGRPMGKWDNRDLWKKFDYKKYGISSEPYFDINFNKVQYITDAGRSWNNAAINLRDKVDSPFMNDFKHTDNIIEALAGDKLSNQIMINIHPEHWADSSLEWWKIWIIRKVKNTVKRVVIKRK